MLRMQGDYDEEQRAAVRLAVEKANAALAEVWERRGRQGRKYFVSYIELNAQMYDRDIDAMILEPLHFLCGSSEEPLEA